MELRIKETGESIPRSRVGKLELSVPGVWIFIIETLGGLLTEGGVIRLAASLLRLLDLVVWEDMIYYNIKILIFLEEIVRI